MHTGRLVELGMAVETIYTTIEKITLTKEGSFSVYTGTRIPEKPFNGRIRIRIRENQSVQWLPGRVPIGKAGLGSQERVGNGVMVRPEVGTGTTSPLATQNPRHSLFSSSFYFLASVCRRAHELQDRIVSGREK